eukprot:GFKZ01005670.1.p1 GENE.GFKZ01005670.1~~GFKZ01005670.1.p1  ORF type:complete len:476 (-),score=50.68 GFKZ01005670.1:852-2279(-)
MFSIRTFDFAGDFEELSELIPAWLNPLYWLLIILLALLAAVINAGQGYVASVGSTAKSTLSLIALDSITYFTLVLSLLFLIVAAIVTKPWHAISPAFLAPLSAFVASCIYAHSVKLYESQILTLWLRASSMTIVNNIHVHPDALFTALQRTAQAPQPAAQHEHEIIALVRADSPGGLARASANKGSPRPFLQVLKMWWQQGTAQKVPSIRIRRRFLDGERTVRASRTVTHAVTLLRLDQAGCDLLQLNPDEGKRRMKVMTAFNHASRHVVHARYGNVWMRASGQPGLDKAFDAWWFIGSEIVQSLKASVGVDYLSAIGRYENVEAMWDWVDDLGFEFRRHMQTKPIAEEIGKQRGQDPKLCVEVAANMALGADLGDVSEDVVRVAREANVVACVGLAIKAAVTWLQGDVDSFNRAAVETLEQAGARVARDNDGNVCVAATEEYSWPEHELAIMIVNWVSDGCQRGGRPGAPAPLG